MVMSFDLSARARAGLFLLGVAFVVFLGLTDHATGYEMSFSIFYLIPILTVSWFLGAGAGAVMALISGSAWLAADLWHPEHYSHFIIPYWNAFVRFGFFMICSQLLSALRRTLVRERELARTDVLTGVENARSFFESAAREIERNHRHGRPLALAYVDMDNFKQVNDLQGHSTGDLALKAAAGVLVANLRRLDSVARLGGDEFAVLMPETDADQAVRVMERVRAALIETMRLNSWPITFSIGLAVFKRSPMHIDELIRKADELMYEAKREGKDTIRLRVFGARDPGAGMGGESQWTKT